ncbi:hypothetical protein F610DRAFT_02458 [Streptomyces sp. LaPpAH-199]|nr:hypothetical protein F610DRAFT_02458 [Streptomyces sp. LaPpAH-199]
MALPRLRTADGLEAARRERISRPHTRRASGAPCPADRGLGGGVGHHPASAENPSSGFGAAW